MDVFAHPFLMAPMAGVTDCAFRQRLRRNGAKALWTEMVSAAALVRGHKSTMAMLKPADFSPDLVLQLFGAKPDELSEAAAMADDLGWSRLDFNMGCPVKKVVKTGSGAAHSRDPALAGACLKALRKSFRGILTAKIRKGWTREEENYLLMGKIAQEEGVDGVILHGRTRADGYSGKADWEAVEVLASALDLPVAGNGDLDTPRKMADALTSHGVKAVMVGRAALAEPWLFRDAELLLSGATPAGRPPSEWLADDLASQLSELLETIPERAAVALMKKFVAWSVKGTPKSPEARNRIMKAVTLAELKEEIELIRGV